MPWRTFSRELERKRRAPPPSKDPDQPRGPGGGGVFPTSSRGIPATRIILTARLPEVGSTESRGPARFSTTSS